ncbi:CCA tRNA nucleotidyltransferase [Lysinibacillus sp. LZ02]|uniref:CCA tRNA nucleotidyltransferase n=1 Tax=Lysinibacillus sp. LZ02 TaxID=3420668 RepID=UPI003D35D236
MKQQWNAAKQVIRQLEQAGFEAVFVGGAVRDLLLARPVHDIDVATSAMPEEVKTIFAKTVDIGIEHGTVLVLDAGEPVEVTTYRTEGEYADHRRPDDVIFVRSLAEDLKRRDFTMNAIAMDANEQLIDLYNGQQDITKKIIRAVGNPLERFAEDALRMLRAVRFSAQLGFTIEQVTLEAIKEHAQEITFVARERIAAEFEKIWVSGSVKNGIDALVATNLADYLPGNITKHQEKWTSFQTKQAVVGWAYLSFVHNDWQEIVQGYRLSNKQKLFIQQVLAAYDKLQIGWQPLNYFEYDLEVLETAYDFVWWQGNRLPFPKEQIRVTKANLPIQTKQQLAANGHDFIQWNEGKRGPWLKVVIDQAIEAVLSGKLQNDNQHIKDWFINEFEEI